MTATFQGNTGGHISIWTGTNHPLVEVGCNNNSPPVVEWDLLEGTTYWIRTAGQPLAFIFNSATLSVEGEFSSIVRPTNDDLLAAIPFNTVPFTDTQNSFNGTAEPNETQASCGTGDNSIWWQFTAPK